MPMTRADESRRATLPDATPGDLFDIRTPGNGDFSAGALIVAYIAATNEPDRVSRRAGQRPA